MFKDSLGKLTRGESLSEAEATEFIENMRDDVVNEMQIAGFLVALLMKGPSVDEVAARVGYADGVTLRALLRRRLKLGIKEIRRTA